MRITASLAAVVTIVSVGLLASEPTMAQTNLQTNVQAPGPTSTDALVVQPIEPFLRTPLAVSEVTPTTATLQLVTTIDLACVVVFGPGKTFGRLALDDNMGAAAHRDHRVTMRGLEPDTVYSYRLQGSAPDGTLYASRTMAFRTAATDGEAGAAGVASATGEGGATGAGGASGATGAGSADGADGAGGAGGATGEDGVDGFGTNVATPALGAVVTAVSSEYSAAFGGANAIDGNPDTEWSTRGDGNAAFITITLPDVVTIDGFGMWTRTMGSSAQIRRFDVVNERGERFGPFTLPDASGVFRFPAAGRGRSFTFQVVDSSGGNTGAVEVEVFARPEEP